VTMSLEERVSVSRRVKPDLFVSIHANSLGENRDCSDTRGFGIYYYAPVSREAAQCVYETMCADGGDENIGLHQENFYVCRTSWAPALLIEAGFMPNARDFECLIDPAYREAFAGTLAGAITVWFADKE